MIECDPTDSAAVPYVAIPPVTVPVPSVVLPSLKVIVPVANDGETVAVNVIAEPNIDGFADEAKVTVELALFTVCVNVDDALPL